MCRAYNKKCTIENYIELTFIMDDGGNKTNKTDRANGTNKRRCETRYQPPTL